jgi:hypothetical protein
MTEVYPKRAANLAARVFRGEAIIMNPSDSTLFNLNQTATAIWLAADGRTALSEIVERDIIPAFDIDSEAALRDAGDFARALAEHSILTLLTEPEAC